MDSGIKGIQAMSRCKRCKITTFHDTFLMSLMETRRRAARAAASDSDSEGETGRVTRRSSGHRSEMKTRTSPRTGGASARRTSPRLSKQPDEEKSDEIEEDILNLPDFEYPLSGERDFVLGSVGVNGVVMPKREQEVTLDLVKRWCSGKCFVINDESVTTKLSIVAAFINVLQQNVEGIPPVLIIVAKPFLKRWILELKNWAPAMKVLVVGGIKGEKKGEERIMQFQPGATGFNVLLVKRESVLQSMEMLGDVPWSSVIVDDFAVIGAPVGPIMTQAMRLKKLQTIVITSDFEGMHLSDVASIRQFIRVPKASANEVLTADMARDALVDYVVQLTVEEIAESKFFYEYYVACPMTQIQEKAYLRLFSSNQEKLEESDPTFLCSFAEQLRMASTYPFLLESHQGKGNESPHDNATLASGKMIVLTKILNNQKLEDRKVAISCDSFKTAALVHTCLLEHQIAHFRFDNSSRQKQTKKLITQFNNTSGFSVLIIPSELLDTALPIMEADTLVLFDSDWSPLLNPEGTIEWTSKCVEYPSAIFHLITKDSYESIVYEYFWRTGVLITDFEKVAELNEEMAEKLKYMIKLSAQLVHAETSQVRGTSWAAGLLKAAPICNFCAEEFFPERPVQEFGDNFWKELFPEVVQVVPQKPVKSSLFWTEEKIREYVSVFRSFGFGRWANYSMFGRAQNEVVRVGATITRIAAASNQKYKKVDELVKQIDRMDLRKLESIIIKVIETVVGELNDEFLHELDCLTTLNEIVKPEATSGDEISLEGCNIERVDESWTQNDDKNLLFQAWKDGLQQLPDDRKLRAMKILDQIAVHTTDVSPKATIITLKPLRRFTVPDHAKVVNHLMNFGLPDIKLFKSGIDLPSYSVESVQRYVNNILRFCSAASEERKNIVTLLAEKVPKYTASKIPQRIQLFNEIRAAAKKFHEFPAEDIEFLTAISAHGFVNYEYSPVLTCACYGNCSEIKLFKKVKTLLSETHQTRLVQHIPSDIQSKLPIRVSDMLVITNLGEIQSQPEWHSAEFVYPKGYTCCCVCPSPTMQKTLIWIEGTITEKDGKPYFVLHQLANEGEFEFGGFTPDEPYEEVRKKIAEISGKFIPPFDGHEMLGLTTALFHKIVSEMPGLDQCTNYIPRHFRSTFRFISQWPIIGQFEKEPEKLQIVQTTKFKFTKKMFGDMLPPLVLDFKSLFTRESEPLVVDVFSASSDMSTTMENYEGWLSQKK